MLKMSKLVAVAESSRDTVNKWDENGLLSIPLPETQPGVTRYFPRENALEITFRAAAMQCGMNSSEASTVVKHWLALEKAGKLPVFWSFNPSLGFVSGTDVNGLGFSSGAISVRDLMVTDADDIPTGYAVEPHNAHKPASKIFIVNLGELVRRIDEALKENSK